MKKQREIVTKKRFEILKKRDTCYSEKIKEITKRFKKEDIETLLNDKETCKMLLMWQLDSGGSDGMWKGRAAVYISALIDSLFVLKNEINLEITPNRILSSTSLNNSITLLNLMKNKKDQSPLNQYLNNLPGFVLNNNEQPATTCEQHAYITMQFTYFLNNLEEHYKFSDKVINLENYRMVENLKNF